MDRYKTNLAHLELVAEALNEVLNEVTFVGGCTTILFVDESALSGVRQTEDVDIIVDVATRKEYYAFSDKLRSMGFKESHGGPICRWIMSSHETHIKLDVMPDSEEILGFSNRWYSSAMESAEPKKLPSGRVIRVVNPGHFLATKFEAFLGRGEGDYAASHDLEDIIFVLENRTDLIKELFDYPKELKQYLAIQAQSLINDRFLNVLPGLVSDSDGVGAVTGYLRIMGNWNN